jgi:hypothetical protein
LGAKFGNLRSSQTNTFPVFHNVEDLRRVIN